MIISVGAYFFDISIVPDVVVVGASFQTFIDKLGNVFSMEVFGDAQFFTTEPEHIKVRKDDLRARSFPC